MVDQQLRFSDSGISATKTILNIFKTPISREYIKDNLVQEEKGTALNNIKEFFEKNNFNTKYQLFDINDVKGNSAELNNIFPFIIPIKSQEKLDYVVVNGIKKGKLKIYNTVKGKVELSTIQELKNIALLNKNYKEHISKEDVLKSNCINSLKKYNLNVEKVLSEKENNIADLYNKLSYFNYISENFGFKNIDKEKLFLIDLLQNQTLSDIPNNFKLLSLNGGNIKKTSPLILTIKPNENSQNISEKDYPKKENIYWKLFKQLGSNKKLLYTYLFTAIFSALFTQLAVFTNQVLIDHILPSFKMDVLALFTIGLIIYKIFDIFTSAYKRFVGIHLGNILDQFFLQKFDTKINTSSLPFIQSYNKGDLIERISDSLKLKQFFISFFTTLIIEFIVSLYCLAVLFYIDWKIALIIMVVMILFYFWFLFITPYLKRNERLRYIKKAEFLSRMIEKIEGIQVIKSFGIEHTHSNKINKTIQEYLKIQLKNGYINLFNKLLVALIIVFTSIVIIVLLTKTAINDNLITLGQIVTFIALSTKIFSSIKSILNQNIILRGNEVILKRFLDFEEKAIVKDQNKGIYDFQIKTIQITNLHFGYELNVDILKDINLEINKGDKIQIEGKNGEGKSTLSKILTILYQPSQGEILINNTNAKFYSEKAIKNKVLLSANEDILFNDSLEENITLGKNITVKEILKLAKEIDFYDFIASKEKGLDFIINENGKNLSTGQRKKVLLLRAFFSTAEIIILDEVLSGIDDDSRNKIESFINKDYRTFIIISHEPIQNIVFSKKYQLNNGKLQSI